MESQGFLISFLLHSGLPWSTDRSTQHQHNNQSTHHPPISLTDPQILRAQPSNLMKLLLLLTLLLVTVTGKVDKVSLALMLAVEHGNEEDTQKLLEGGGNPSTVNRYSISLLHTATSAGHQNIVKMLLEYNATIDYSLDNRAGHREGETALHFAAADNQPECAQVLLQYGADWKKMTSGGMTALHLASGLGHIHFIKTLLPVAGQEWYGCCCCRSLL